MALPFFVLSYCTKVLCSVLYYALYGQTDNFVVSAIDRSAPSSFAFPGAYRFSTMTVEYHVGGEVGSEYLSRLSDDRLTDGGTSTNQVGCGT